MPALEAGVLSIGDITFTTPASIPTSIPSPPNFPLVSVCISLKISGLIYAEYGSSDCKTPLIASSITSALSISSTYSFDIFSKTSLKRSIFS